MKNASGGTDLAAEALVEDAISIILGTPLPPAPWVDALKAPTPRPSERRLAAYDRHVFPEPEWGLNVNLSASYIGPLLCERLCAALAVTRLVTTLDLSMCDLRAEGCIGLVHALKSNPVIRHLSLAGNRIGPRGAVALAEWLAEDRTGATAETPVEMFPVRVSGVAGPAPVYMPPHKAFNSRIIPEAVDAAAAVAALKAASPPKSTPKPQPQQQQQQRGKERSIDSIPQTPEKAPETHVPPAPLPLPLEYRGLYPDLSKTNPDADQCVPPPTYLRCSLESLSVPFNALGDEGAVAIANAVRRNPTIRFLNLRGNNIGNLGAFALLDALHEHAAIERDAAALLEAQAAEKLAKRRSVSKAKTGSRLNTASSRGSSKLSPSPPQREAPSADGHGPHGPHSPLPPALRYDLDNVTETQRRARFPRERTPPAAVDAHLLTPTISGAFSASSPPAPHVDAPPLLVPANLFASLFSGPPPAPFATGIGQRLQARWAALTPEQRYAFLSFNFPALFDAPLVPRDAAPTSGSPPNPIIATASQFLGMGNATLGYSLLPPKGAPIPVAPTSQAPRPPPAGLSGSDVRGPRPTVLSYKPRQLAPPQPEHNAGGFFIPRVVRAAERAEALFTDADGFFYRLGLVPCSIVPALPPWIEGTAVVTLASAVQFLQATWTSTVLQAPPPIGGDSAPAIRRVPVVPTLSVIEAAQHAARVDYHCASASMAAFHRPGSGDSDPDAPKRGEEGFRFSGHLPSLARTEPPSQLIPRALLPRLASPATTLVAQPTTHDVIAAEESPVRAQDDAPLAGSVRLGPARDRSPARASDDVPASAPRPYLPPELRFLARLVTMAGEAYPQPAAPGWVRTDSDPRWDLGRAGTLPFGRPALAHQHIHGEEGPDMAALFSAQQSPRSRSPFAETASDSRSPSPDAAASPRAPRVQAQPASSVTPRLASLPAALADPRVAAQIHVGVSSITASLVGSVGPARFGAQPTPTTDAAIEQATTAFGLWTAAAGTAAIGVLSESVATVRGPATPGTGRSSSSTLHPTPPTSAGPRGAAHAKATATPAVFAEVASSPASVTSRTRVVQQQAGRGAAALPTPVLPLPVYSVADMTQHAQAALYGTVDVARVAAVATFKRTDVCPDDVCVHVKPTLAPLLPASPLLPQTAVDLIDDAPPTRRVRVSLPQEAVPYIPLADALLRLMRSPLYTLVDPLTAFLRGRERDATSADAAATSPLSWPAVSAAAANTAPALATALALQQRGEAIVGQQQAAAKGRGLYRRSSGHFTRDDRTEALPSAFADDSSSRGAPPKMPAPGVLEMAVRLVNLSEHCDGVVVAESTLERLYPTAADRPSAGAVPIVPLPPTLDSLITVAGWECADAEAADAPTTPCVVVDRNTSINALWLQSNDAIDPVLMRALTMVLQLRNPPKVPPGYNKKAHKSVLEVRERIERRKM